jgi:hypothetical protein
MRASSNGPLSRAEILREATLIWEAISVKPQSPRADILSPSRQLTTADEERVMQALEEMARSESG